MKKCTHKNKIVLPSGKTLSCKECMEHDLKIILDILAEADK
ncbi:hypothetical protein [Mycoplasma mycoides]|nr:hypothetical protein [Mycoplasma mycoides]